MNAPVRPELVRGSKPARPEEDLRSGFGKRHLISRASGTGGQAKRHVSSNGFESGMRAVESALRQGTEKVRLDSLSAGNFLECDSFL